MSPITAMTLVPVIMWLSDWPLKGPTEAQASALALLVYALILDIRAAVTGWLDSKGTPPK
jgi:hypothetical protein